jgi:hypothetical protein
MPVFTGKTGKLNGDLNRFLSQNTSLNHVLSQAFSPTSWAREKKFTPILQSMSPGALESSEESALLELAHKLRIYLIVHGQRSH